MLVNELALDEMDNKIKQDAADEKERKYLLAHPAKVIEESRRINQ